MVRFTILCLLASLALPAMAQYAGPGVKTCQEYAEREARKNMATARIVFDADADLAIEKYTQKAGSQFVSSILRGNGALIVTGQAPTEFSFVCLLADEKRAVFFDWQPRRDAPVLGQCRRTAAAPSDSGACFEQLQSIADQDLLAAAANRFQAALEADKAGGGKSADAFRATDAAWRAYRDAECRRRQSAAGPAEGAVDVQRACVVELTRRRARDLREKR